MTVLWYLSSAWSTARPPHAFPFPCQANDETFKQRYFVCDKHYRKGGPIFFYLGNEADVTLYLNNSGKRGLTVRHASW